jgi:hypothetical protein
MIYWLLRVLGIDDASGPRYAFWSGLGSDLAEFGIIVTLRHRREPDPGDAPDVPVRGHLSSARTHRNVTGSRANTSSRVVSISRYSPGRVGRSFP